MSKSLARNPPREHVHMPHWMWIWKVGSQQFCEWPTCSHHVHGWHIRDGEKVAFYCKEHFPPGLPVINGSIAWCEECDEQAKRLDYDGVWRCDTHGRMEPTNQITGSGNHTELLQALTDEQLTEQIAYYQFMMDNADAVGRWKMSSLLAAASVEDERRRRDRKGHAMHDRRPSQSTDPA